MTTKQSCGNVPKYEPTPEEIAAAKAEIQAEWSEHEEQSRHVVPPVSWCVPGAPGLFVDDDD